MRALGELGSEAGRIFGLLGLGRPLVRRTLDSLKDSRVDQVTVCSIICATRFKFYDRGTPNTLRPTSCPVCNRNRIDSFDHLVECTGLRNIPRNAEFIPDYLRELAQRARRSNPGYPLKYTPDEELFLVQYSDSSLEEISF